MKRFVIAAHSGTFPGGVIEDGTLRIERLEADAPEDVGGLFFDLYHSRPAAQSTDILMEVEENPSLTEAFAHLHTSTPCRDKIGLLNLLLADALYLGLS